VRCVIAAGWAVEDGPAMTFATTFYDALLRGRRFIDAVSQARETAHALGGNTWAAYQCYGDPDWSFRREGADAQRPPLPLADEFGGVASPDALTLALETLAVRSRFQQAPAADQRDKIRFLEARFVPQWGGIGAVAESFGLAWAEAGDPARAVSWYERALATNDGSASIKAIEQLGNLRLRLAWATVDKARSKRDDLSRRVAGGQPRRGKKTQSQSQSASAREMNRAERALRAAVGKTRKPITEAVALLNKLVALRPSMERESLLGSAYKRLAMIEAAAGRPREEARALASMKAHYERAEALGRSGRSSELFYPALNRMAAELVLDGGRRGWKGFDRSALAAVRESLIGKARADPDFWSIVGLTELRLYEALAGGKLAAERNAIEGEYRDLQARVDAVGVWGSVYDQARFVLPKYAARAGAAEQKAADGLLALLHAYASGAPSAGANPRGAGRADR
jgi:tetratricopeptide (TPR) repeat protein